MRLLVSVSAALLAACGQVRVTQNQPPPNHTGPVTLYWTQPLSNTDGSLIDETVYPLTYNIYQGPQGDEILVALGVSGTQWSTPTTGLTGVVCWAVRAVPAAPLQSASSTETCMSF